MMKRPSDIILNPGKHQTFERINMEYYIELVKEILSKINKDATIDQIETIAEKVKDAFESLGTSYDPISSAHVDAANKALWPGVKAFWYSMQENKINLKENKCHCNGTGEYQNGWGQVFKCRDCGVNHYK